MPANSFIEELEEDAKLVAELLWEQRDEIVEALAPNGKPFGFQEVPEDQQAARYQQEFQGNPEAWKQWIRNRVRTIMAQLEGLAAPLVASVHPWSIAETEAMILSSRMEAMIAKRQENTDDSA